ncbi:hypothetical protein B0H15DRAFT_182595 [Mycena belliarum]|uniref:cAMP-independent regulatory protein pac2 n=1 Tax=Mycena belliarum TaxID=1033014 RepID=A0AAD6U6I5_9AGAR|nr:hypothetical protein B0H15DRAFT_182595 [Mycena belliae]
MPALPQPLDSPLVVVQQPTCTNLRIRSVNDAHKIFFGIRKGLLRMVTRRLDVDERAALCTGCVYAWEERGQNTEITGVGIERFTEGRRWSASRVRDEFLFYYEKFVPDPNQQRGGSAIEQPDDWKPLVKQTYSVWVDTERGRKKWHLTAYFTQLTVDGLDTVDNIEDIRNLDVPHGMFTSTRVGKRKHADVDAAGQSTITRIYAPYPSPLPPLAPRPIKPGPSGPIAARPPSPSVKMYDPYSRPHSQVQQGHSLSAYYGTAAPHSFPPPTPPPQLHYSYSPNVYSMPPPTQPPPYYTRQEYADYSRSDSAVPHHPAPTYSPLYTSGTYSKDRVRLPSPTPTPYPSTSPHPNQAPQQATSQQQQPSGYWYTSPMVPYRPREGSPRSEYTSSSSSSSYASSGSPTGPSYPVQLYSPEPTEFPPLGSRHAARLLPRLEIPPDPFPPTAAILLSPTESERRGDIGPCRDLAPLNSLTRRKPYWRDPTDDNALRRLGPRPAP